MKNLFLPFQLECLLNLKCDLGQKNGSTGKGVCCQALWPEFNHWDPYGGWREPTLIRCPLITKYMLLWSVYMHMYAYTQIRYIE